MNFWEARQAALEGKKVKLVSKRTVYYKEHFTDMDGWKTAFIDAEWEIVEERKPITAIINVYSSPVNWVSRTTIDAANLSASDERLSCIEIITDENGKLVSAKNV